MLIQLTFIYLHQQIINISIMEKFNLQNILIADSRNGYSMAATLTINGKPVCRLEDEGAGSQPEFEIFDRSAYDKLVAHIEELPEVYYPAMGTEIKIDLCMFIDLLNYALETKTEFKLLSAA